MENLKDYIKRVLMIFGLITIIALVLGKMITGILILILAGIYLYSKELYYDILDKLSEFGDAVLEKTAQIFNKKDTSESTKEKTKKNTKKNKCDCCSDIEY